MSFLGAQTEAQAMSERGHKVRGVIGVVPILHEVRTETRRLRVELPTAHEIALGQPHHAAMPAGLLAEHQR